MRRARLLMSLLAIGLAGLSMASAIAWFSDSGAMRYTITAASDFGDHHHKVWVCKMVGPPDHPWFAEGRNPIHVADDSLDAGEAFSDAHPSFVVDGEHDPRCKHGESGKLDKPARSTTTTTTTTTTLLPDTEDDQASKGSTSPGALPRESSPKDGAIRRP